jgi:uncharacterized protein (TIGR03083 family)
MRPDEHVQHLRTHAAALLAACRAEPATPVPSCPGWDRAALLGHVGVVHSWVRTQLAAGPGERKGFRDAERPPEGEALFDWFEAGAHTLVDGLAALDPTETWPTWAGPRPAAWFPRRMAQETAVHRWDADPTPLDPDLAVDGIDELFELFAARLAGERFADVAPGTIHLHATDEVLAEPGEWLVSMGPDGVTAEKGHAKGDVALRGPASDLLLWTWNRVPTDRFDVIGDDALARRWSELVVV